MGALTEFRQDRGYSLRKHYKDETKPDEKYALVYINDEDSKAFRGSFINFNGDKVIFTKLDGKEVYSISSWYHEWAIESDEYVYIDFSTKTIAKSEVKYGRDDDIGYGKYFTIAYGTNRYVIKSAYIESGEVVIDILNISKISSFSKATVLDVKCGYGEYYTVCLKNSSGVFFSSVIDKNGNIILAPTKDICLGEAYTVTSGIFNLTKYRSFSFSENGLCKAKDTETGLFGFIDLTGKWVIEPKYESVTDFSDGENSVAVVNGDTIINAKGEVVFTAETSINE